MNPILRLIGQRVALGLLTLFGISILVFLAVDLLPGDPAQTILGQSATPESVAALRQELGLDRPLVTRYVDWISGVFVGDFGRSLANDTAIAELVLPRLNATMILAALAAAIAIPLGLVLGVVSTVYRESALDRFASSLSLVVISSPEFLTAYMLVAVFSVGLGWLPAISLNSGDMGFVATLVALILPAVTLALSVIGYVLRMTRAAIMSVMASPYIEMARLKGAGPTAIVVRHALPNALSPIINVVIINLAYLVVGVVVVEVVFVYPGLGQLLVDSVSKRDIPVVQACCILFAATYITFNLLADVLAALANPRIRHPRLQEA